MGVRAEDRVVHPAELQAGEDTSGLQNTVRLLQHIRDTRAVADAERNRVQVIRVVRELRHLLRVRLMERNLGSYQSLSMPTKDLAQSTYCCDTSSS